MKLENTMKKKAIIIGAGIAGPIMAIQLKNMDYDVAVFESRPRESTSEGAFLGITPNGLNVLSAFISLSDLKKEYTPGSMRFMNNKGKQIAVLLTGYQKEKYGSETIQVKRARLNALIRDAAEKSGVKIHYEKKCAGLNETPEGVEVRFDDGEMRTSDVLIACDGVFSTVRKNIFPDQSKPNYTRNISTGGYARLDELQRPLDHIAMTFGERGFFAYSVSNQGEIWWFNNYRREMEPSKDESGKALKDEVKRHLLSLHQNDDPVFSKIIKASHEVIAYPVYDIPMLEKWHTKRICLIGDAAHATSPHIGQGASLALEDTVVLALALKNASNPEEAFGNFQHTRKNRVEKIIRQARKIGDSKSKPNRVATWFRDLLLGFFINMEIKKLDWVYGYRAFQSHEHLSEKY